MSCNTCGKPKCTCVKIITQLGKPGKRGASGKTVIGPEGPAGPAGPSNLTIANTVFVMKNGNDSTGLVERLDKPFLTIAGARTAALIAFTSRTDTARIRVIVESGYYQEDIVLNKFIDYELGNCVINGSIVDNNVDFGVSGANVWTNIIYGQAKFYNQRSSGTLNTILIFNNNTKLLLECDTIASQFDDAMAIIGGFLRIHANRIYTEEAGVGGKFAIEMAQGFSGGSGFGLSRVEVYGADIFNSNTGSVCSTISFESGATEKNQELVLVDCRVKSINNPASAKDKSAIACGSAASSNGKLLLYNTVLYSLNGDSIHVTTGNTLIVYYYHSNMSNKATAGAGTLTSALSNALTVNAAVLPGF